MFADQVNERIALNPTVQQLAAHGYTVSVRHVNVSTNGVNVLPAFCRIV